jgi:cell division protein FtsB
MNISFIDNTMAMKQKPKTPLSSLQRKRLLRISFGIFVLVLLWIVFAPGNGMYHLRQQKKYLAELTAEQEELVQQNKEMEEDIERLQNDEEYLEEVAREKHGMLKDNEMIFDFAEKKKK